MYSDIPKCIDILRQSGNSDSIICGRNKYTSPTPLPITKPRCLQRPYTTIKFTPLLLAHFHYTSSKLRLFWDRFWNSSWILSYKPNQTDLIMTLPLYYKATREWPPRIWTRTIRRRSMVYGSLAILVIGMLCTALVISTRTGIDSSALPARRGLENEKRFAKDTEVRQH